MAAAPLQAVRDRAGLSPGAVAVLGENEQLTYSGLVDAADGIADALSGRPGPVGIQLPSGPRLLTAFIGAVWAGRPACVLHNDFADAERGRALAAAGVTDLLTQAGPERLEPGGSGIPGGGEDPCFYVGFTSGTSGTPKPFTRRWSSWELSFAPSADLYGIDAETTVALPGGMQHSHFLFGAVLGLECGARVRTWERFDARSLIAEMRDAPRSVLFVVPTMLSALDREPDSGPPLSGVRCVVVSGSAYDARHRAIARRLFPRARIVQIYGASELSFVTVAVDDGDRDVGDDVGRPFPGVEIELREAGEIWVRSPYLFAGYLEAGGLDDLRDERGFATVGDLGAWTSDRRLELIGRASNMLITGGKNVHPEEIEAVIRCHPAVRDCVVVGMPDDYWGQRLEAALELREDTEQPDERDLSARVRAELAPYKTPKAWHLVGELPRTASGKVIRRAVVELLTDG